MSIESDVKDQIRAMKHSFCVETDKELAQVLGVDPTAISAWKRRNKIPYKYQTRISRTKDDFSFEKRPEFIQLKSIYIFSLVGFAHANLIDKQKKSYDDAIDVLKKLKKDTSIYKGYDKNNFLINNGEILYKVFSLFQLEFEKIEQNNKDALRKKFDEGMAVLSEPDFFVILDMLISGHQT